jgi:hypothetical protein
MSEPSAQANVLAERLESREFVYMAELVASATKREEEVLEVAAKMGAVPQIAVLETGTLAKEFEANVKAARFVDRRG